MGDTFVVIGGVAAGLSAASKAKRDDPDVEVIVFERGEWVSYAACGMPYVLEGRIERLEDLVAVPPDRLIEERGIDLRLGHEVTAIDPETKAVAVETGEDSVEQSYDHLLIGTGARAIEPPLPGTGLDGVFVIRDMEHTANIDAFIDEQTPERAAVVGGGYVGIEMAEALIGRNIDVKLFELLPHVLEPFGQPVADRVEPHLQEQGVALQLETPVERFVGESRVEGIVAGDESVPADLVIVGVGVEPNAELAEDADIEVGPTGAIATDEFGRTSAPDVYAAGDCAEMTNVVTGEPDYVPLGLTANRAGRAIGQTVTGTPTEVGPIASTAIVKAFELEAARTGILDESEAREAGFDPVSVTITDHSRAGYYPGATEIDVTLLADRASGRLLGGSVVGREGAKRIDTIATELHAGLSVTELQNLDLAYAPPFSPVWDPVLTAGKVLGSKLEARE